MNCSCNATSIDGDGYCSERYRVAARDHVCPECGEKIAKGDKYLFSSVFIDGTIRNSKICADCESVTKQFFGDGYYVWSVWEDLASYLDAAWCDDLPSNCISKLSYHAKQKVCDIMQQYQEATQQPA
jgi:hypothetical protein